MTAAYGIFYEPYYTGQGGPLQTPISAPPYLQTPQISLPNFSDPYNGSNPFNGTFAQPMTLLTLDKNLSLPYAQDWNLNIERAFGSNWLLQAGYVGTKGTKLPRFIEGNPTTFPAGSTANNADQRRLYSGCTIAQPVSLQFLFGGFDCWYRQLKLQRAASQFEEALQPAILFSRLLHAFENS